MHVQRVTPAQTRLHRAALGLFAERGVTQVTVSDLAGAAGVARGTVYNNFARVDLLFEDVARGLTAEMSARIANAKGETAGPAQRLANAIRWFVQRAHEDPPWGRFIVRFGVSSPTLQELLHGIPSNNLEAGMDRGQFTLRPDQLTSAVAMVSGSVLGAMGLVLEGHRTWRDAGSDTAELVLRALGVSAELALSLATGQLPPLPSGAG